MTELLTVVPLAIVMIAGPQIVSAVFLATSTGWARNSVAYVTGAAASISIIVAVTYFIVDGATGSDGGGSKGGEGDTLDVILLVLLLLLAFRVYRGRKESKPPKWMGRLQEASPGFSFKLGFLLLGVFPTDIITSVTVATKLAREGEPLWQAVGFLFVTLLLLALPALAVLALGSRARTLLPKIRDWMNTNSWLVSEFVIAIFVVIQLNSLLD